MEYLKIIFALPLLILGVFNVYQAFTPFYIDSAIKKRIEKSPDIEEKFKTVEERSKAWQEVGSKIQILTTAMPFLLFSITLIVSFFLPQNRVILFVGIGFLLINSLIVFFEKKKLTMVANSEIEKSVLKTINLVPRVGVFFSAFIIIICY